MKILHLLVIKKFVNAYATNSSISCIRFGIEAFFNEVNGGIVSYCFNTNDRYIPTKDQNVISFKYDFSRVET